jgi:hypothetical protein
VQVIFKTPSAPKTLIIRPKDGDPLISPEQQKQFGMGVGMLLYLLKHSCPYISNSVRELTKVADGATGVTLRHFCTQSSMYWVLMNMVYFYSQSLMMMASIWKEYLLMNRPESRTHKSVSMVMSYTFVVHL